MKFSSLPTRECGLKFICKMNEGSVEIVTPYAGVWIEIVLIISNVYLHLVTPYAGVWIEIKKELESVCEDDVTPYAGVWIEM